METPRFVKFKILNLIGDPLVGEKLMARLAKAILSVEPLSHEYETRRSREGCVDTTRVIRSRVR